MRNLIYILLIFTLVVFSSCTSNYQSLKVVQLNVWHDGKAVPNGFLGLVDIIDQTDSDVVLLQEIRSQKTIDTLIDSLQKRGKTYYGRSLNISTAIMSKYPLVSVESSTELGKKSYAFTKGVIEVKNQKIAIYSIHLDWLHVGYYLARGYSGTTWDKLDSPVVDADSILNYNRLSRRKKEVEALIANMHKEAKKGHLVILGGDFNEPSHLDWQEETKDIRDHNGMVVNWDCSKLLEDQGCQDVYREMYPNAISHPGFTCNAGNKDAEPKKLQWSLGVDDRERIDFIYYLPSENSKLEMAAIIGPKEDFFDGRIQIEDTKDNIIIPQGVWPSDHKGNFAEFKLYIGR